jgi:hypothetical protein
MAAPAAAFANPTVTVGAPSKAVATHHNPIGESNVNRRAGRSAWVIAIACTFACVGNREGVEDQQIRLEPMPVAPSLEVLGFQASGRPAWLNDSTMVLVDRDEQQLVMLDISKGEVRRGGGKGAGPGEMENAITISPSANDGIFVLDMQLNRVNEYDNELAFTRSQPVPGMPLSVVDAGADGVRALWMTFRPDGPDPRVGTIDMMTGNTRSLIRIFDATRLERPETNGPFEPLFVSAAPARDGGVRVGIGNEYRIVELDEAGAVRSTFGCPDLEAKPITDERIAARREASLGRPDPFFGPNAFATDTAGRLWVVTSRSGGHSTEIDVFSAGGRYLQTLELKANVTGLSFRGDRLAVLVTRTRDDIDGFNGIDLYRVN